MVIFAVLWYNEYIAFSAQKRCEFSSRQRDGVSFYGRERRRRRIFRACTEKRHKTAKNASSKPEKHPSKSGVKTLYIIVYENHGEAHNEKL